MKSVKTSRGKGRQKRGRRLGIEGGREGKRKYELSICFIPGFIWVSFFFPPHNHSAEIGGIRVYFTDKKTEAQNN